MFQVDEAQIISNTKITKDIYLMKLSRSYNVVEGQFFMMKPDTEELVLYRPISIFDIDRDSISFLYLVKGRGTAIFSKMREGDRIKLHGPYGNGFPNSKKNIAIIGGGIGMAPLLLTAKRNKNAKVFIGIRENLYTEKEIKNIKELFNNIDVEFKIGGFITEIIDFKKFDTIFTCGPKVMMKAVSQKHNNVFVSLESHMGCGLGACLSCSCKVNNVMQKVCKDGPVFLGKEVF